MTHSYKAGRSVDAANDPPGASFRSALTYVSSNM